MNRKEITKFLTDLLIKDRLSDRKYYAKEVTLDYFTAHPKHVDVMEFRPKGVMYASDIEKGYFVSYEIKSCIQDVYSGNGLGFYCEKNYIVTTMETYRQLQEDLRSGKLKHHIMEMTNIKPCPYFGVMVPVPAWIDLRNTGLLHDIYENPQSLSTENEYRLWTILPQEKENSRARSMNEMLFYMLRSKHSATNRT